MHIYCFTLREQITFICQSEATCGPIKFSKFVCGRGSATDPARGATLPTPLVSWGGGHPHTSSPDPTPLGAFGASILAPSALVYAVTNLA